MGLFSGLFGSGAAAAGDAVKSTLQGVGSLATDLRSAITGEMTPDQKAALQQKILDVQAQVDTAQAAINQAEAQRTSVLVAGWRPGLGWICVLAFGLNYLIFPLLSWAVHLFNWNYNGTLVVLPQLDITTMMPVLLGILGLGSMRTVEKMQNAQGNH